MASSSKIGFIIGIILLVSLNPGIGGEIVFEGGYTVTTVIDGDKLHINPYSVFSLHGSSSDLVILDSVKSTFYTVSFSDSQVSEIKKLSGNGDAGYGDGALGSAVFNKPKSFALDMKNNIYIADKTNHVIRKISKSGVTTIAGGYIQKTGNVDGPAQNASFSDDFELSFAPERCALLISDHGNRLVRQIDLKAEDCAGSSSGSGSVLGSTTAWTLGVVVACLIGLIVGFAIRPYVLPHGALGLHLLNGTWKHYLINLAKQAPTFYSATKSAIVSLKLYHLLNHMVSLSFSQLSLLFGLNLVKSPPTTPPRYVSLLDCDDLSNKGLSNNEMTQTDLLDCDDLSNKGLSNNEMTQTEVLVKELRDLVTFDNSVKPLLDQENDCIVEEKNDGGSIDRLIYENLEGFVEGGCRNLSDG